MAKEESKLVAPYVPFKSFITSLDYLQQGTPTILDRTVWPTFSGGLAGQMLAAYRFLGFLTEDYEVTDLLERAIDSDRRKEAVREAMRKSYEELIELEVDRATPKQLSDYLGELYNVSGSTHKKALTFFLHTAKFVELPLSPAILRKTRNSSPRRRKASNSGKQTPAATRPDGQEQFIKPMQHSRIAAQDSLLLWGLFQRLPKPGSVWCKRDQEQWVQTLQNVFSLEYRDTSDDEGPLPESHES